MKRLNYQHAFTYDSFFCFVFCLLISFVSFLSILSFQRVSLYTHITLYILLHLSSFLFPYPLLYISEFLAYPNYYDDEPLTLRQRSIPPILNHSLLRLLRTHPSFPSHVLLILFNISYSTLQFN